ncbi:MAG TPA: 3-dehydroquinate synthase [Spirochaetia bacterium]|nr:3-dehydroquinate synthase [Spirochaetia bacterium]
MINDTLTAKTPSRKYNIYIGRDLLDLFFREIIQTWHFRKTAVIIDSNLHQLYAAAIAENAKKNGCEYKIYTFPAGEESKSREQKAKIEDFLFENHYDRSSCLSAFGGGVAGDLTGFTASTYYRGIPFLQYPTSILACVDSSIGGKTGINTRYGKNLIGTYHQPHAVYVDLDMLDTLPDLEFRAGFAEVIKTAVISDKKLFSTLNNKSQDILSREKELLAKIIYRCIQIKKNIVEKDERESGFRMILNFGHTIAHALEKISSHSIHHGDAVAIGMCYEAKIASMLGILPKDDMIQIENLLKKYHLPVKIPAAIDKTQIYPALIFDKKAVDGSIYMSLPHVIGEIGKDGEYVIKISKETVDSAIRE